MAEVAKAGTPSLCTMGAESGERIAGDIFAGEALAAGDACYIKPADGAVYRSLGAAAAGSDSAQVHGFTPRSAKAGDAVSLYLNVNFRYGASLTPGKRLYLSDQTPGALADAPTVGGTGTVGFTIDASRIRVRQSSY